MIRGILYTLVYYGVGVSMTVLTYHNEGHGYAHAPTPSMLVGFLFLVVGVLWAFGAVAFVIHGNRSGKVKGILITHMVVLFTFLIWIVSNK